MVLDPEPNPAGNVVIRENLAVTLSAAVAAEEGEVRYVTHWATCPKSKSFKR